MTMADYRIFCNSCQAQLNAGGQHQPGCPVDGEPNRQARGEVNVTAKVPKPVRPGEEFTAFLLSEDDDDLVAAEKLRYACAQVDALKGKLAARDVTISRLRSQLPSAHGTLATIAIAAIHKWCEDRDWMGYDVDCLREDLPRAVFQALNPGRPWPPTQ